MTYFRWTGAQVDYKCGMIPGMGSCIPSFSEQVVVHDWPSPSQALAELYASCGDTALLQGFHFEFSDVGHWAWNRAQCASLQACQSAWRQLKLKHQRPRLR